MIIVAVFTFYNDCKDTFYFLFAKLLLSVFKVVIKVFRGVMKALNGLSAKKL